MDTNMKNDKKLSPKTIWYYIHSAVALLLMFGFRALPPLGPLTEQGMAVVGIFLGVVYAWSTASIIWPALLGLVSLGFIGENTVTGIFQASFGSDTYLLVFFILVFAAVVNNSGVSNVIANWIVSRKFSKGKPWVISLLLLTAAYALGALISVTPGIIIPWAILYTMCDAYGYTSKDKYPKLMVIGVVLAALMGHGALPFKALALMLMNALSQNTGETINYATFTIFAVVLSYAIVLSYLLVCRFLLRPDVSAMKEKDFVYAGESKMNSFQKQVLVFLGVFFLLFFLPGLLPAELAVVAFLKKIGNTGTVVLLIAFIAFLRRRDNSGYVNMVETIKTAIPWETMILLAFALPITSALTNEGTGVQALFVQVLDPVLGSSSSSLLFISLVVILTVLLTNVIGNMVVGLMMVPLVCIYAASTGVSAPMLVVVLSVLCNVSLFLPSASPLAALLHGNTQWVSSKDIYKYTIPTIVASILISILICSTLGNLLF